MKNNLISFLFGESQVDAELAGIVEAIADIDTDNTGSLKVNKKPLATALSAIGIENKNLVGDTMGLALVFDNPADYREAHALLNDPESLNKLAELGWVYSMQGDVAMSNEPAEFRIRFLDIYNVEPSDEEATYSDSDTTRLNKIKDIVKKGREFATTAPDFDSDANPVDHSDPKEGSRDKGVGKSSDGEKPKAVEEGAHKEGCTCGFCKNKGNISSIMKAKSGGSSEVESVVDSLLRSAVENQGTPSGIFGRKSYPSMKVPGGNSDRAFKPAKGMKQAYPENSVVDKQTKKNKP